MPDVSGLPGWAQSMFYVLFTLSVLVTAVVSYAKKQAKDETAPASSASVISASFIDSKLLKELIEAMRELQEEQGRDAKRSHKLSQDLRDSVIELNESIMLQTDASMNIVRFVNREANKNRLAGLGE